MSKVEAAKATCASCGREWVIAGAAKSDNFDGLGWHEYMRAIENGNIDPTGERLAIDARCIDRG